MTNLDQSHSNIPNTFYRVSVKALIVDQGKILLSQLPSGKWELPGGGLDWGEDFHSALKREFKEETGVLLDWIEEEPSFVWPSHFQYKDHQAHTVTLGFKATLPQSVELVPNQDEYCVDLQYFSKEELKNLTFFPPAEWLSENFNPADFE